MEKKVCKTCGNEINKDRVYCNKVCYMIDFKHITAERNKKNIGKKWEDIMGKEKSELRKNKKSEQMSKNNVSTNPEVSKKISKSLSKYKKNNPPVGVNNPFYGKKHTDEYKEKSSQSKKGKRAYNDEQYQKLLLRTLKKENHPGWNGGSSKLPYPFEFNKQLKEFIKKRDLYKCVICHKQDEKLAIHHIDYNKENIEENNLVSLCFSCHGKTNYKREYWYEFFTEMTFCHLKH